MDLRSTLMMLKAEAFFGGCPLMKLDGQQWRLSKITYAIQAFYGSLQIINMGVDMREFVNLLHAFTIRGSKVPQFL
nr:unnamed protein product [Callosobruchus analis]